MTDASEEIVEEGLPVKLLCRVEGNPKPEVHWEKNGLPVVSGGNLIVSNNALFLSSISRDDEGTWSCVASNIAGMATVNHQLTVVWAPVSDDVIFYNSTDDSFQIHDLNKINQISREGIVGEDLVLSCNIDAKPIADFEWFFDGSIIETRGESVTLDEQTGSLTITNIGLSNEGK